MLGETFCPGMILYTMCMCWLTTHQNPTPSIMAKSQELQSKQGGIRGDEVQEKSYYNTATQRGSLWGGVPLCPRNGTPEAPGREKKVFLALAFGGLFQILLIFPGGEVFENVSFGFVWALRQSQGFTI